LKIGRIILAALGILIVGIAGYLLMVDVPIKQTEISKEIPHDQFSQ
jgi:preprotein translocase subunit Sss1